MIMEPSQIQHEMARVLNDESYLQLKIEDFADICPNPTWGIHVHMRSIDALIVIVKICLELVRVGRKELRGIIVYIRGLSLTMGNLARIDSILPRAQRFKRGLGSKTNGPEAEIWIFAEVLQENG